MISPRISIIPLAAFVAVVLLCVGALSAIAMGEAMKVEEQAARIKKLEAESRKAWGQVYGMQEKQGDEIEAVRSEESVARYELQLKLDQCTARELRK